MSLANPHPHPRRPARRVGPAQSFRVKDGLEFVGTGIASAFIATASRVDEALAESITYAGIIVAALGGIAAAAAGARNLVRWARARRQVRDLRRPATEEQKASFRLILDRCAVMSPDRERQLREMAARVRTDRVERASFRASLAAHETGRLDINDPDPATPWIAIAPLFTSFDAAADVAIAVLVRDLISPVDFELLTSWWVAAGEPITAEAPIGETAPAS